MGPLVLHQALEQSCDVYFYTVAMRLGLARLVNGLRQFNLGKLTHIGLAEEAPGFLPHISGPMDSLHDRTNAIFMGIGQGPIAVTPLQMACAYTALLRGGEWMRPQIIQGVRRPPPRPIRIRPADLAVIKQGMWEVVHAPLGTAFNLKMKLPIAGKTGTAQTAERLDVNGKITVKKGDDGWFASYAPATNPRYVAVCVVEMTSKEGAGSAGPIVRQTFLDMEKRGYLPQVDVP